MGVVLFLENCFLVAWTVKRHMKTHKKRRPWATSEQTPKCTQKVVKLPALAGHSVVPRVRDGAISDKQASQKLHRGVLPCSCNSKQL